MLLRIKEEAEFYGLDALVKECERPAKGKSPTDVTSYMTIRKYISDVKEGQGDRNGTIEVENSLDMPSSLTQCLSELYAPFCLTGKIHVGHFPHHFPRLFKNSSFKKPIIEELLAEASQSAFGRGLETVTDTSVRNSFEIEASRLNPAALRAIRRTVKLAALVPHLKLQVRPYKLVIYREGGHFDEHRDTVRGEGHIGTLVFILNSEYTGGELEVSHCGRTETVTGAYNWVAMYGDCLHKINPVTSGTRVSLIYDIYGTSRWTDHPKLIEARRIVAESQGVDPGEGCGVKGSTIISPVRLAPSYIVPSSASTVPAVESVSHGSVEEESAGEEGESEDDEEKSVKEEHEEGNGEVGESGSSSGEYDSGASDYWSRSTKDSAPNWLNPATTAEGVAEGARCRGLEREDSVSEYYDTEGMQEGIVEALNEELGLGGGSDANTPLAEDCYDAVIIALQHLYPLYQASPAFLKGADRALYDLLSEQFDVQVVAATIYREAHPCLCDNIAGSLFTPALVDRALNASTYKAVPTAAAAAAQARSDTAGGDATDEAPNKKQKREDPPRPDRVKLVISAQLDADALLDYTPYLEETGNESQCEESVYLIAGLQVRRIE